MGKVHDVDAVRKFIDANSPGGLIVVYFSRKCYSGSRSSQFSILQNRFVPLHATEDREQFLSTAFDLTDLLESSQNSSDKLTESDIGIYVNFSPLNIEAADEALLSLIKYEATQSGKSAEDVYIECLRKTSNPNYSCIRVTVPRDMNLSDNFRRRLLDKIYTLISEDSDHVMYSTWCGYYLILNTSLPEDIILPQYEGIQLYLVKHIGYMPFPGTYEGTEPIIEISSSYMPDISL